MTDEHALADDEFLAPWREEAACVDVDPDLFFPERGGDTIDAKRVCARCPVSDDCLEFALVNFIKHGVWGGKSERERRALRSQRHRERNADATTDTGD